MALPLHLLKIDMPKIVVPLLTTRSWNAKITTMATLTVNRMSQNNTTKNSNFSHVNEIVSLDSYTCKEPGYVL